MQSSRPHVNADRSFVVACVENSWSPDPMYLARLILVHGVCLVTADGLAWECYLASANLANGIQLTTAFTSNGPDKLFFDLATKINYAALLNARTPGGPAAPTVLS